MYLDSAVIIGLGSLGSHIALEVARKTGKIILVDNEIVQAKNLDLSLFRPWHIGKWKSDSIAQIIRECISKDKIIKPSFGIFKGEDYWKKVYGFVIDCSDTFVNLNSTVDIKLYITGRDLIIDMRNDKTYHEWVSKGRYTSRVTINDMIYISKLFGDFLSQISFDEITSFDDVLTIYLDSRVDNIRDEMMKIQKPNKYEMRNMMKNEKFEEEHQAEKMIGNLRIEAPKLLNMSQTNNLKIVVREHGVNRIRLSKRDIKSKDHLYNILLNLVRKVNYSRSLLATRKTNEGIEVHIIKTQGGA